MHVSNRKQDSSLSGLDVNLSSCDAQSNLENRFLISF